MLKPFIAKVSTGEDLTFDEASEAMDVIMRGDATESQIAGFIIALKLKGEKVEEVAGFVNTMRIHCVKVEAPSELTVDGCGTGGDSSHSFNISTTAAVVASAAGVIVAKHGNRSVTSKCGSADLLEKSGGKIDLGPEQVEKNLKEVGFAFMFAPRYHPAMKHAAVPRRELGVRTIFNILGPMTNPALVKHQVLGVYNMDLLPLVAQVLAMTGSRHVITAHSKDGLDEFSVSAETRYIEVKEGSITNKGLHPEDVGLKSYPTDALAGGDAEMNLAILHSILNGKQSAYRDAVLYNSGAIIYVGGQAGSIKEGVEKARTAVESGAAKEKFSQWIKASNA